MRWQYHLLHQLTLAALAGVCHVGIHRKATLSHPLLTLEVEQKAAFTPHCLSDQKGAISSTSTTR